MADPKPEPSVWSSGDLGFYFSLSQIGVEMAAPIGLGVLLDNWLGCWPWITVVMAVLGPAAGIVHMLLLLKSHEQPPAQP